MRIAIDAMGGDYAPWAIVKGSVEAAKADPSGRRIVLVGQEEKLREELEKFGGKDLPNIDVIHASEVVEMEESPLSGLRVKKDASIAVAANLVKAGEADALVSAGNTGAVVMATKLKWRFISGISRPGIASYIPTPWGCSLLIDAGANIDCKPMHLLHFAVMGDIFARCVMGKEKPRIGLLSVGTEAIKGNELTREGYRLISQSKLNFVGNIEGKHVFSHKLDVIVTDGFVGNVVLKLTESISGAVMRMLKDEIVKNWYRRVGALILRPALMNVRKKGDYSEYGGAPLLGVNGICIICHGGSSAKAIRNAIRVADNIGRSRVNEHIETAIKEL